MYFRNYGLQKMWFDNCLKKAILEHSSRSNMVNRPKHLKSERQCFYHTY